MRLGDAGPMGWNGPTLNSSRGDAREGVAYGI